MFILRRIIAAQKELAHMGGPVATTRGGMVHTVLRLCCAFEDTLTNAIDGGKDGEQHSAICDRVSHLEHISAST